MANHKLPVYCIDDFMYDEAIGTSFYINKLSRHLEQHQFTTQPHRHAFYLLIYFTKGNGRHIIDFVSYDVKPGAFFIMTPGQVHQWALSDDTEGEVLFFSKPYYENYFNSKRLVDIPLFKPVQLIQIGGKEEGTLLQLFNEIREEYMHPQTDSQDIITDYLDILISRLSRQALAQQNNTGIVSPANRLIRDFEKLVDEHFSEHNAPAYYSDKLHISVKYLNQLCKQNLDKTTTQIIHERLILEAQRLLVHDELSVNAIAEALNFDDFSYFTRFFKKMTGDTPGGFRKKHGQSLNKDLSV